MATLRLRALTLVMLGAFFSATFAAGGPADGKTTPGALPAAGASAQGTPAGSGATAAERPGLTSEGWHFVIAPYGWAVNTSGEVTLGPIDEDFELPLKTVIEQLKGVFFGRAEARNGRLGIVTDYTYVSFAKGGAFSQPLPDGSSTDGDLEMRIEFWEVWAHYRLGEDTSAFDLFAGIRYNSFRTGIDFRMLDTSTSRQFNWTDPLVGARWLGQVKPKLALTARADFAGFGAGSQFTLNLQGGLEWQFHRVAGLVVEYRWMDIDYEKGDPGRLDFFKFDASMHGPLFGLSFAW